MLEVKNLHKKLDKKVVLEDISFSLNTNSVALFLGKSGVGKSTLLRILNDLESSDSGQILLHGEDVLNQRKDRSDYIGMVFQGFHLFEHLTVMQNIVLPLHSVMPKEKALALGKSLLEKYQLLDKQEHLAGNLSGGQKQRLAIIRAIAKKPLIICMDEPTSALDPWHSHQVYQHIQMLKEEGFSLIITSHDVEMINHIDCTIYLVDQGRIIESVSSLVYLREKDRFSKIRDFLAGKKMG